MDTLLERFLRYVKVETTADESSDSYPSTPGQLELGRMLRDELLELGLDDARQTDDGIVIATLPPTVEQAPTIAWFAHVDTSPETTAEGVKPQVVQDYSGEDIVLPGDPSKIIRVSETPELKQLVGKTIITTDGTTLLGADDKAGVAVIMTAVDQLLTGGVEHGPIKVVFTCDEEIGRGTDKIDLQELDAVCGYTLDGESQGYIENETFSADQAIVTITGVNIHPGLAYGRMVNAVKVAGAFLDRLPRTGLGPENTRGKEPYVHPYTITGGVAKVTIRMLLRSFDATDLDDQAELLQSVADTVLAEFPGAEIVIERKRQYRNMKEYLDDEPRAVRLAVEAMESIGVEPRFSSIRGGTDGSRLSEMGLPTPNLSTGMYNFHSPLEFACLEEMGQAVRILLELAGLWGRETGGPR